MATAVILAGGKSSRMGRDKQRLLYGGKTFLAGAVERFQTAFDTVWVSVGDPDKYPEIHAECIEDLYPGCGPLAGLHAALRACRDEGVFLVAADMPFSSPAAAVRMIQLCGESDVCALTDEQGRIEPLFAYYKKSLADRAEELLRAGRYKIIGLCDGAKVRIVTRQELDGLWQDRMLDNINYPEDYEKLLAEQQ